MFAFWKQCLAEVSALEAFVSLCNSVVVQTMHSGLWNMNLWHRSCKGDRSYCTANNTLKTDDGAVDVMIAVLSGTNRS